MSDGIRIATIRKNARGEFLIVELSKYNGHDLVAARVYYTTARNELAPTPKGFTVRVALLPQLVEAFKRAHAEALRQGLLDDAATAHRERA